MTIHYDQFGKTYAQTRQADSRIVSEVISLLDLPSGSTIADIAAGTKNYSRALAEQGFRVLAVEPSAVMRAQAVQHSGIEWSEAGAENLPFPSASVNGAICILALHHFNDSVKGISEMLRVIGNGPLVIFTFDPRDGEQFWLYDYFPYFYTQACGAFPPLDEMVATITGLCGCQVRTQAFPLPHDLYDLCCAAAWRRPELYLDSVVRANISSFTFAEPSVIEQGIHALQGDLQNGQWNARYGELLQRSVLDAGYRFIAVS